MVTGLFCLVYAFKQMKFEGQNYLNRAEQHTLFGPVLIENLLSFPVGEGMLSTLSCLIGLGFDWQLCFVLQTLTR